MVNPTDCLTKGWLEKTWQWLITNGFYLLYHQLAWTYDLVSWMVSFGAWRSWQKAALPFIAGPNVLEIAHGPGHMLLELHRAGFSVYGLDLSPQMIRLAKKRLKKAGLDLPLIRGAAQDLPFPAGFFDTILTTFPADFIVEEQTLTAVYRLLKPGGRFIIVPQAEFITNGPLISFVEWLYTITGQRQGKQGGFNSAFEKKFTKVGLLLKINYVELANSRVTVLVCRRGG